MLHTAMAAMCMCQQLQDRTKVRMVSTYGAKSGSGRVLAVQRIRSQTSKGQAVRTVSSFPGKDPGHQKTRMGQLGAVIDKNSASLNPLVQFILCKNKDEEQVSAPFCPVFRVTFSTASFLTRELGPFVQCLTGNWRCPALGCFVPGRAGSGACALSFRAALHFTQLPSLQKGEKGPRQEVRVLQVLIHHHCCTEWVQLTLLAKFRFPI